MRIDLPALGDDVFFYSVGVCGCASEKDVARIGITEGIHLVAVAGQIDGEDVYLEVYLQPSGDGRAHVHVEMSLESTFLEETPAKRVSLDEVGVALDRVAGLEIDFNLFSFHMLPINKLPIGSVLVPLLGFQEEQAGIGVRVASAELALRGATADSLRFTTFDEGDLTVELRGMETFTVDSDLLVDAGDRLLMDFLCLVLADDEREDDEEEDVEGIESAGTGVIDGNV